MTRNIVSLSAVLLLSALGGMAQTPETPPAPAPTPAPAPAAQATPPEPAPNPDLEQAKDLFRKGTYQEALEAAKKVLATQPDELNSLYIAGVSALRLGRLDLAEPWLKRLYELEPAMPNIQFHLGHLAFARAEDAAREGRSADAKALYVEAAQRFGAEVEKDPTQIQPLKSRALALARAGQYDDAIQSYEAWIAAAPQTYAPYLALGSLYAELGRAQEAMSILDRVPRDNKKAVADGAYAIVRALYAKEKYDDTLAFAKKMQDLDLDSRALHGLLAATYARLGRLEPCAQELCKFMSQDPPPEESSSVGEVIKMAFGGDWAEEKGPSLLPKGTTMPEVEKKYSPRYPDQARKDRIETQIMMMVLVKDNGTIAETCTVPSPILKNLRDYGLEQAALECVKRWRFSPATKDKIPMDAYYPATVVFSLR